MISFATIFPFVALLSAGGFGQNDIYGASELTPGTDDIVITFVNDWGVIGMVLGLDILDDPDGILILAVDLFRNNVFFYDATTGSYLDSMALSPANWNCFGIAWDNNLDTPGFYVNDMVNTDLSYTNDYGSSWSSVANPAGVAGRGMDFDGTDYWTTNGTGGGLWRFQPGAGQENIPTPFISGLPTGLAVYPSGSNLGVIVTTVNNYFYFCEWDGATITLISSMPCPPCEDSYGLAYSTIRDSFYWIYRDDFLVFHIAEFTFEMTSLERSTWGSIKNSF